MFCLFQYFSIRSCFSVKKKKAFVISGDLTVITIGLQLVLHSISDEDCVKVLKKCRESIVNKGKGGKVIIIDIVINDIKDEHKITEAKLFFDMLMMAVVTGRERCEKEWEKLFLEAGFRHYKITPMFGLRSLIEVYP
jgi:trans-resveratrol di-O-methyltransferase